MKFLLPIKPVLVLLLAAMILAACASQPAAAPAGSTQPAARLNRRSSYRASRFSHPAASSGHRSSRCRYPAAD